MRANKDDRDIVRLALPKGHIEEEVFRLMADAGIRVKASSRSYRPTLSVPGFQVKILRPQNIAEMLHLGSHDIGFAGADWKAELNAKIVELVDTGLNPVRLVAAAPSEILVNGKLPRRKLVVASEYQRLARRWIRRQGLQATFVFSYGATEVFPPEDADCIIDNTATGSTLSINRLEIVDELMTSTTRLYAHPAAMDNPPRRESIERLVLLLNSVLEARRRVMLELNVPADRLDEVIQYLPAMRKPTISPLYGENGYAVKVAAPRDLLPTLIPRLKAHGGSDIVVTAINQIAP